MSEIKSGKSPVPDLQSTRGLVRYTITKRFQNNNGKCELDSYKNSVCIFLYYRMRALVVDVVSHCSGLPFSTEALISALPELCHRMVHKVVLWSSYLAQKVKSLLKDNTHTIWLLLGYRSSAALLNWSPSPKVHSALELSIRICQYTRVVSSTSVQLFLSALSPL